MTKTLDNRIEGVGWFLYDAKKRMVCLQRRDEHAPQSPNSWDHFGGGAEDQDKTELDTLAREIEEELEIKISEKDVIEIQRGADHVMYYLPFPMERTSEITLREGAGLAWLTFKGAFGLPDLTWEARERLQILKEWSEKT